LSIPSNNQNTPPASTDVFVRLLMEHRHRLFAFLLKQLVHRADAEDVFQKTSVILWQKMEQYDPTSSFFHWSCGIAFNEVRNFRRGRQRSRLHFSDELTSLLAEEAEQESEQSQSRLHAMQQCLEKLSQRQRDILRQCYASGRTITEVAGKLGRERTALYKQLARLRDKVAECMKVRLGQAGEAS